RTAGRARRTPRPPPPLRRAPRDAEAPDHRHRGGPPTRSRLRPRLTAVRRAAGHAAARTQRRPASGGYDNGAATAERSGPTSARLSPRHQDQWNESPQAQLPVAFGLSIVKPCLSIVSAKSITAPLR